MDDAVRIACSVMGASAFALTFVPYPLRSKLEIWLRALWEKLFSSADPFVYIQVPCKSCLEGTKSTAPILDGLQPLLPSNPNPFYEDVALYLGSLDIEFETRRVSVYGLDSDPHLIQHDAQRFLFGLPLNETLADTFSGVKLTWTHTSNSSGRERNMSAQASGEDEDANVFVLTMLKCDKRQILRPYLHHISATAYEIRRRNTFRTLYTNTQHRSHWIPVTFKHPSTFDTIALDCDLAERIQADLKAFSESKDYYHSIGRAWKRGYLLYGPPGTGKSSLIAAIANFMQYDIYDLELTNVVNNSQLKTLLMQTKRKAVIVIEDIDCSMSNKASKHRPSVIPPFQQGIEDLQFGGYKSPSHVMNPPNQQQGLTLSGLLNFADGLLSCFGEERIIIFTTNHKEKLDTALLRCGRMDMHILLSYCTFSVFKKLAFNYLGIKNHSLYEELEEAMRCEVKITPASVAEILLCARNDPDTAIQTVLAAVKAGETLGISEQERPSHSECWEGAPNEEDGTMPQKA